MSMRTGEEFLVTSIALLVVIHVSLFPLHVIFTYAAIYVKFTGNYGYIVTGQVIICRAVVEYLWVHSTRDVI